MFCTASVSYRKTVQDTHVKALAKAGASEFRLPVQMLIKDKMFLDNSKAD